MNTIYLHKGLQTKSRSRTIAKLSEALSELTGRYAIAFTGMSGALVAPGVAERLNKPLVLIRKSKEYCHSDLPWEGDMTCPDYVIIDDFIATGNTIKYIIDKLKYRSTDGKLRAIAMYEYAYGSDIKKWSNNLNCPILRPNTKNQFSWVYPK